MRILHINVNYISSALHQTMINHLNKFELCNKVFAPTYDKGASIIEKKEFVTISECFKKNDRFFYFKKQNKIIKAISNSYDVSSFDIIHAYTLFTDGNVAMQLSKKHNIPYVVAVRNTDVNDFFKKMIHLRSRGVKILKNAEAVFFLSPEYRDYLINHYVPTADKQEILNKSYIVPNGIDEYWHRNSYKRDFKAFYNRKKQKEIRFLYVGGINENKNVEMSLKALTLLKNEGWHVSLIAVGKVIDKKVFSKLIEYPFFFYETSKEKELLINYYRDADIFIMPSIHETFGLVYAEAMSQGLPVIYTAGQGFDKQFDDGYVGFAVNPNSPDDIALKIKSIVNNYEEISSRATVNSSKFNWNTITNRYYGIYKNIYDKQQS